MVDTNALYNLEHHFAEPEIGCVCGHLRYVNPNVGATRESGRFLLGL